MPFADLMSIHSMALLKLLIKMLNSTRPGTDPQTTPQETYQTDLEELIIIFGGQAILLVSQTPNLTLLTSLLFHCSLSNLVCSSSGLGN